MKRMLFVLMLVLLCVSPSPSWGAQTHFTGTIQATNTDGSPLTDMAGTYWYCYDTPGGHPTIPDKSGFFVPAVTLAPNTGDEVAVLIADMCSGFILEPYVVATIVDTSGNESVFSNEASCDNNPPTGWGSVRCGR